MLSAIEILELEKKVFKYRMKQRIHYFIISLSLIFIGILSFYLYPFQKYFSDTKENIQSNTDITKPIIESNLSVASSLPSLPVATTPTVVPSETNNSTKYTPKPIMEDDANQVLLLQLPAINKNNIEKKVSYTPADLPNKKSNSEIQEEELDNKVLMRKMPNIEDESFYRSKEDKVDTALLPPPLLEEPKQKGVIKIETHEVNSIQYLKEKFEKTHNIVFALMLAEEYYGTKNYTECNKWALMANNIDPDSEKSWVWFAKSKVKLGHKEDAIVALQAYLKNNKSSKAAQSLLNQINVGEVID